MYGAVRDVPDFPTPGIIFRDITPLLVDPVLFRQAVRFMAAPLKQLRIDKVLAIESRGFILGAPIALQLKAGLVLARKGGKLPRDTHRIEYVLEYGTDAIDIHVDAIERGEHVLVVE